MTTWQERGHPEVLKEVASWINLLQSLRSLSTNKSSQGFLMRVPFTEQALRALQIALDRVQPLDNLKSTLAGRLILMSVSHPKLTGMRTMISKI